MIYLNNAATSFPKPPSVIEAMMTAMSNPPVSPFRSNAQESVLRTETRKLLGKLFNIGDFERIFFCRSATDAINRVLGGENKTIVATS
ncbi:MAG: aminotransferase class V-fold PLP-dependent enzyme, partial [Prevotella sp.]|nr:aminotransferase class V-fold PLP-dependent enzyme [Prevotella sp.]